METVNYEEVKHKFLDSTGRKLILSLFEEFKRPDVAVTPPFKLSDWKKTYLECSDPTEYAPAMALVGDWDHWLLIRNHKTIKPIIDKWALELEVKMRADAIKTMVKHSKGMGGTAAARWIAEGGMARRDKRKPADREAEGNVRRELDAALEDDYERITAKS